MKIAVINGPNLNLLGTREPGIYGTTPFDVFLNSLKARYSAVQIDYFQSNVEGEIINFLHQAGKAANGVILNAGAYTHTSVAIADAVAAIGIPVVEVHLSNIFAREDYRHVSYAGAKCRGSISGLGLKGYELALLSLIEEKP